MKLILPTLDPVQISCIARGTPIPVLSIIFEGKVLSTTSRLNMAKIFETQNLTPIYFYKQGNGVTLLDPFQLFSWNLNSYSQLTKIDKNSFKLDLILNKLDKEVAGKYQCVTYNAIGRDEKSVMVNIFEPPRFNKEVMESMENNEVLEGLPLILACLVTAEPSPNITWFKNKIPLSSNATIKMINNDKFLNIIETTQFDSGIYTCVVENEVGYVEFDFNVNVLVPPKFLEYTLEAAENFENFYYSDKKISNLDEFEDDERGSNITYVTKGDNLKLSCLVVGEPAPEIYWVRINYLDESKNEILEERGNFLVRIFLKSWKFHLKLQNFSQSLKYIDESATYMCYANNSIGLAKKIFQIVVQFAPEIEEDFKKESHQKVELYHGVNLECKISGVPEPQFSWMHVSLESQKSRN